MDRFGVDDGFEQFVAARREALWRSAWLLAGDRARAEDLVQTALAKTYRHFDRVGAADFEAYVRRAMFTTYLAWWRRRWNGETPSETLPERAVTSSGEADVEARHDLVRAMATLPKGQRAVVVLRYLEDLSVQETATVLGCSTGTVKSQAAKALARLRVSPGLSREEVP